MGKQVTIGNLIAVLSTLMISIFIWAKSMETKAAEHDMRIKSLERISSRFEQKLDKINGTLVQILIELQNKVDEKK